MDPVSVREHVGIAIVAAELGSLSSPVHEGPLELNPYIYVSDGPLRYIDPRGLGGVEMSGSELNDVLQDLPDNFCDIWPGGCYKSKDICVEAKCRRHDCKGHVWIETITEWIPNNPAVGEVHKLDPECHCVKWALLPDD